MILEVVQCISEKIFVDDSSIIKIKCDAIVNAAKMSLLGGGGIDKIIHECAGDNLRKNCEKLPVIGKDSKGNGIRCYTGDCKLTDALNTNLKNCEYVIHTVGPDCREETNMKLNAARLRLCYENVLKNVLDYNI